jgi:hypothetical protein
MAVFACVMLAGFLCVVFGVDVMALRHVSVVTGLVVVARLMMLGRRFMMSCGMFVMFCGFAVVFRGLF